MMNDDGQATFRRKELRGSRLRCLMLTSGSPDQVADRLTRLVAPYADVDAKLDTWMPGGFLASEESTCLQGRNGPGVTRGITTRVGWPSNLDRVDDLHDRRLASRALRGQDSQLQLGMPRRQPCDHAGRGRPGPLRAVFFRLVTEDFNARFAK